MPELPLDVIYNNILPRLPVKSLIRFKSVSNQWNSFLKSQIFANMHLNRVTKDDHQNHHNILKIYRERSPCEFSTIDCETLEVGVSHTFPFNVKGGIWVKSSCNGLVFLYLMKDNFMISDLIIWNPLTSDYKTLAKTDISDKFYHIFGTEFELYYNSCDEDYKLVCVTHCHDVYIYSLKTDSWRQVNSLDACQFTPDLIKSYVARSACLNENIYLLEVLSSTYLLTKFDTKTEKFTKIATPFLGNQIWSGLTVQGGCIHLYVKSQYSCFELWMMKRDGEWMRVSTCKDKLYEKDVYRLQPLHLMRDGTWLMNSGSTGNIYKVKKQKHETCKDTLNDIETARYIQTFLSPNQYMN